MSMAIHWRGLGQTGKPLHVIAMGKLGAANSTCLLDIDIVFAYPEDGETADQDAFQP